MLSVGVQAVLPLLNDAIGGGDHAGDLANLATNQVVSQPICLLDRNVNMTLFVGR